MPHKAARRRWLLSSLGAIGLSFLVLPWWQSDASEKKMDLSAFADQITPLDNYPSSQKQRLGEKLFFDTSLSVDRSVSCASCHDPASNFAGTQATSVGVYGRATFRNTPSLMDVGFKQRLTWDGRADDLESQAVYPLTGHDEMGMTIVQLLERLSENQEYVRDFGSVFGTSQINIDHVVKALASYQRTLVSDVTDFDQYRLLSVESAINNEVKRGWHVFQQHCLRCHQYTESNPFFSDFNFYNTGTSNLGAGERKDLGRFYYTANTLDKGKFRTPSLRGISKTAPYMHDGSVKTLSGVIEFYRQIPNGAKLQSDLASVAITHYQSVDLLAFLESI